MFARHSVLIALILAAAGGCQPTPKETQSASMAVPSGHAKTSLLQVERDLPREILAGKEFAYRITVTNVGHQPLHGVVVRDDCAENFTLTRAEPMPIGKDLKWDLGSLADGQARTITVYGKVTGGDTFTSCASASYDTSVCLTAGVIAPALAVKLVAPDLITPCDELPLKVVVTNVGTGTARGVGVTCTLPEGLTTADGRRSVHLDAGTLETGQSREFGVSAKALRTGDFVAAATATGQPDLKAEAPPVTTAVRQSQLAIDTAAPEKAYTGRPVQVTITFSNTGQVAAGDAFIEAPLPRGATFVAASDNGELRDGRVVWDLGRVPVKSPRTLAMTVQPAEAGPMEAVATFKAACATPASDAASVLVQGIPGLLMEVVDLADPIEAGSQNTYEITIVNQGSAPATNVRVVAMLENAQGFAGVSGGTATVENGRITFKAIPSIAPKAKAVLRVTVDCKEAGDIRFRASMIADQLERPVEESESTHVYR